MKKKSKKAKKRFIIFGIPSLIMIFYFIVTLISSTFNYISLRREEKELKEYLLSLQEEKSDLKIEIEKLKDPEYIAQFAKENYLYTTDGEYVIKIEEKINEVKEKEQNKNKFTYISIGLVAIPAFIVIKKGLKSL